MTHIHLLQVSDLDVDNIEMNISSVAADTGAASEELTTAAEYQRRAGRRAACLTMVLVVVVAVVLLAVSNFDGDRASWHDTVPDFNSFPRSFRDDTPSFRRRQDDIRPDSTFNYHYLKFCRPRRP